MYKTYTMELAGRTLKVDIGRVGKHDKQRTQRRTDGVYFR